MAKFFAVFLTLFCLTGAFAQDEQQIKGHVLSTTGEPIIGATVVIKGTTNGTSTGIDGEFALLGAFNQTIEIRSIGYTTQEMFVNQLTDIKVVLEEEATALEEVVVVAMGTQKRNTITAAVTTVGAESVNTRPVTDATSVLQGNVAGLNFASSATDGVGGELGADIKFNIRGIGSINGGDPYVLVDGVEQSLQNVNPADIASITVLKDASAAAVYGARAAYGVVLVTTKSGKKGKMKINYNGNVGVSAPINMPSMMNSVEYATYVNQRSANQGLSPLFSEKAIENMKGFMNNPYSAEYPGVVVTADGTNWASAVEAQYANTDWFNYYYKDYSLRYTNNLSFTGGSEKTTYYIGLGHTYQGGLLDHVEDNLNKFNLNSKVQVQAREWLRLNLNNNLTLINIERPLANQTIFYGTVANTFPNRTTHLPVESSYNLPVWNEMLYMSNTSYNQTRLSDALTMSATVSLLEGWDIMAEMKGRFDIENNDFTMGTPAYALPNVQADGSITEGALMSVTGGRQGYQYPGMHWKDTSWGSYTRGSLFNYYLSPTIASSYSQDFNDHFFKAQVGFQAETQNNSNMYAYRDGMLTDDVYSFANGNGNTHIGEARTHWSTMGFYTRLNWDYKNIYFVEVSGRYDGSSRFAPDNRWGLFPSVSVGYDMARSPFFEALETPISQLKIRASYGRLGNQNGAGFYDYLGTINVKYGPTDSWLFPDRESVAYTPKMISSDITWEKVDNANLGIDLMMFDNRLSATVDMYQRTTRDMIGPAEAISSVGGIAPEDRVKLNNATLQNRGWEFTMNWNDKVGKDFTYGIGFNVFDYQAIVTEYNNPDGFLYNNHTGLTRNQGYYEGMDIGEIWGYQADDLFMTNSEVSQYLQNVDLSYFGPDNGWRAGDVKFQDTNGDGKVDPGKGTIHDSGDLRIIGNTTPRFSYGVNFNLGYKGFSLSGLFQGVGKRDFVMTGSTYLFGGNNYFNEHLDYWSMDNPHAYLPRLTGEKTTDFTKNVGYNTSRYILDASYIRLKNITLSYNLPKKLLTNLGVSKVRVYCTGDNLLTFDKLPSQFDPETIHLVNTWAGGSNQTAPGLTSPLVNNGNGKVYPLNRTFTLGLDVSF